MLGANSLKHFKYAIGGTNSFSYFIHEKSLMLMAVSVCLCCLFLLCSWRVSGLRKAQQLLKTLQNLVA
jgi:hypothetical protein